MSLFCGIATWSFCSNSLQKRVTSWTLKIQFWKWSQTCVALYIQYALVPSMHLIVKRYCGDLQVISESAEAGGDGGQSSSGAVRSSVFIAAAQRRACGRSGLSLSRSSSTTQQPQHKHPGGQQCHYSPPFDQKTLQANTWCLFRQQTEVLIVPFYLKTSTISDSRNT